MISRHKLQNGSNLSKLAPTQSSSHLVHTYLYLLKSDFFFFYFLQKIIPDVGNPRLWWQTRLQLHPISNSLKKPPARHKKMSQILQSPSTGHAPKKMGLLPLEFADCLLDSPYFRENLRAHEKQLDQTSADIKGIIKDVQVNHKNFHIPSTKDCSYMYIPM